MSTPHKPRSQNNDIGYSTTPQKTIVPSMNNKSPVKLIVSGILLVIALVITLMTFKVVTIEGNQLGIKETWANGVESVILQPKTYFLFPGWSQTIIKYDASLQKFVMNDKGEKEGERGAGRARDSYKVQSQEGQDMTISMNLQWRIDPVALVVLHKTVRTDIEEKIIRPALMRVVKDAATTRKAIEAYSGEGLVKLQADIQHMLSQKIASESGEPTLSERGIIVGNFVIEHIELDPKYIEEIKGKQIATQQTLRAVEEQKAAEAKALVAKATAQADLNTQVVGAERDAKIMVVRAEAENEKAVIAAKAEQQKLTLEAEGKKAAMIATAEGTLAMGKAEAQAKELMLKAWAVPGAESFVKVEVSKNLSTAFSGIKGYLPEKMTINTFTDNFMKGLDVSTGNAVVSTPTVK